MCLKTPRRFWHGTYRTSKHFPDVHGLIMHTYHSDSDELLVDHLGLHKALCILMGWNYLMPPENSKAYQMLSADDAVANQDDLIMWPPSVLIHNTLTGKGRDGRMEGIGNRPMDSILRGILNPSSLRHVSCCLSLVCSFKLWGDLAWKSYLLICIIFTALRRLLVCLCWTPC